MMSTVDVHIAERARAFPDEPLTNLHSFIDEKLRELLDRRIKDGIIRRIIDKWLKAGVLEDGRETPKHLIFQLNQKMQGHYGYYGITFNYPGLNIYCHQVRRMLYKWLNRRGGKPTWCWIKYTGRILEQYPEHTP
ncbi:MAG: hypothetical protein EA359_06600 [Balneolaceae bacterium]|nr:MAG: hypothetical protein EA359_06600 [Balneolaceae bacterium]